jgi:K+-transporting ATPase ATPase C chain
MLHLLMASLRVTAATIAVCVAGYAGVILGVAQVLTPATANGSLITRADGTVVGSRLIAQKFEDPAYFWPRPSAVDYNGAGAGGSNKSPTSEALTERAEGLIARHGATPASPLPPELAAASGGGLDPHVSQRAAEYQAPRVAAARGMPQADVLALVRARAFAPGGPLTPGRLVNVLELNLALDDLRTSPESTLDRAGPLTDDPARGS